MVQGSLGQEAIYCERANSKMGNDAALHFRAETESETGEVSITFIFLVHLICWLICCTATLLFFQNAKRDRSKSARLSEQVKQIQRRPTSAVTFAIKNKQRQKEFVFHVILKIHKQFLPFKKILNVQLQIVLLSKAIF